MNQKQKTIQKEFALSGVGLHTGNKVKAVFKPASEDSGIIFIRVDLPGSPRIKADHTSVHAEKGVLRCTTIGNNGTKIHTVEHLMSVLCGLGIDNLTVELDSNELPGLDGSAIGFLNAIKDAGIVTQNAEEKFFAVREPIGVEHEGSSILIVPAEDFNISYTLDYNHPVLRSQFFSTIVDEAAFEKEIAPCRTFCLEEEAEELKKNGLGKGANYENTLVVGEKGVKDNKLRFPNEFVRHKILDLMGDLYLLGMPVRGRVFAFKSGHALNLALLKKISQQKARYEANGFIPKYDYGDKKEMDIQGIMNILPHRYPFLLLDRIVELENGKRAVGIKNVTINDSFFQGHFPGRPIMPGVLMIEAMAQTAGIAVLTNAEHHGKVAFFMSVDNVKFRRVVTPGDQLFMEVEVIRDRPRTTQIRAVAKVAGEVAAEADMMLSFTDASYMDQG